MRCPLSLYRLMEMSQGHWDGIHHSVHPLFLLSFHFPLVSLCHRAESNAVLESPLYPPTCNKISHPRCINVCIFTYKPVKNCPCHISPAAHSLHVSEGIPQPYRSVRAAAVGAALLVRTSCRDLQQICLFLISWKNKLFSHFLYLRCSHLRARWGGGVIGRGTLSGDETSVC